MKDATHLGTLIVKMLVAKGYIAYFAGGWVRDYLLKAPSQEIDIATSASPEQVLELFPHSILVGIRFGVVVVLMEGIPFEVTSFRTDRPYIDGRHPEGVDYSTPEKDAERRDFTINGMFFDPLTETLYDFVGGREDLKNKTLRAIGDPRVRFSEDKLRMLRAVRFTHRLQFYLEEETKHALQEMAPSLLPAVSMERVVQELTKMSQHSSFSKALEDMYSWGLLSVIFPQLSSCSSEEILQRLQPFPEFPPATPLIFYLLELLVLSSIETILQLCSYLKLSNKEMQLALFYLDSQTLFSLEEFSLWRWAHFYAHPASDLVVKIQSAKRPSKEREAFFQCHRERQELLSLHIARIEQRKPLVTAEHLAKMGIKPGVQMGLFLKEAEKIAINSNFLSADQVIDILRKQLS